MEKLRAHFGWHYSSLQSCFQERTASYSALVNYFVFMCLRNPHVHNKFSILQFQRDIAGIVLQFLWSGISVNNVRVCKLSIAGMDSPSLLLEDHCLGQCEKHGPYKKFSFLFARSKLGYPPVGDISKAYSVSYEQTSFFSELSIQMR